MLKKFTAILLCAVMLAVSCFAGVGQVSASELSSSDISASDQPVIRQDFGELKPSLSAQSASFNSIRLSWDALEGAARYELWIATSRNGTYTLKASVDAPAVSFTNGGRIFNKVYYYKLRGINADGEYSRFSDIATTRALPSRVSGLEANAASYKSIKLSWDKVSGASGYTIYRSTSKNGTYTAVKRLTSGSTLSWTNGSLTTGKTYYYKVRAYRNSNGKRIYGEYSDIVSTKPRLTAPKNLTLTNSSYMIIVKWSQVTGATGYKLYRSTDPDGEFALLGTITSGSKCSFKNSTVVPGVTYYYKLTATRNGSESEPTAVKSASAVMAAPTSVNALSSSWDSVRVTWKAVSGATGYTVFRSDAADGEYEALGQTTGTSFSDSGLITDKTYYYKVQPYRTSKGLTGSGNMSAYDPAKPVVPSPTLSSAVKNDNTSIKVSWRQVSSADGYYVYRSVSSDGSYTELAKLEGGDTLSYIDTGRSKNTAYYYKVRAYKIIDGTEHISYFSSYQRGIITTKVAYLTFDDGPSCNTMEILDILDDYGVKATFFVIAKSGRDKEYKAIVERGHTIALHSYTHTYSKVYASEKAFFSEMERLSDKIYNITGVRTKILRFPGGSSNTVYKKYCSGLMAKLKKSVPAKGYYYHDWNVSSGDASGNNIAASKLLSNVKGGCKGKNTVNILMHDTGSAKNTTVDALPSIIKYLKAQGYDIQPITEDSVLIQH